LGGLGVAMEKLKYGLLVEEEFTFLTKTKSALLSLEELLPWLLNLKRKHVMN
jgi:hypothetical protein